MSLEKSIKHGKEAREEYRGAKSVSKRCRNHGDCAYCSCNRQISKLRLGQIQDLLEADLEGDEFETDNPYSTVADVADT